MGRDGATRRTAAAVIAAAERLPAEPGAYVLTIEAPAPIAIRIATLAPSVLAPGRYAYVGSARGPGGIRARVRRHLRADKKIHWHVDRLTAAAGVRDVAAYPGADECAMVAELLRRRGAYIPVPGFGSSDCRRCRSHLVALP